MTPEYNHGIPGALKNALIFLYAEWNNKSAGFVSYGNAGGVRAVEQLRPVVGELQMADVQRAVHLALYSDFGNYTTFRPAAHHQATVEVLLTQVVAWANALRPLR